ncbi:MAG: AAA family ATPase [Polyangiaceae bacterium]
MRFPSRIDPDLSPSRFEIRRLLGWGGMGVVYEAFDRERRQRVALKTLRSLDAAGRLRFKNEFRSLVDLAHPNLVRLGELLEENGQLFFTMELVAGVPFVDHVRGSEPAPEPSEQGTPRRAEQDTVVRPAVRGTSDSSPPTALPGIFDEARLRESLAQLAHGLGALHASGRVHRDIKPSNVLVTKEGRLVILDFGLVTETWADEEPQVVGTAHFMAPEQAAGKSVGPAADWYAVGVMLYLAMTGVLPFDVASDAVASVKQTTTPLPPSAVVPGIPADLDALTMALLRIDPGERAGLDDVLEAVGEDPTGPGKHPAHASLFVGRTREIAELSRAFDDAVRGDVRAMIVEGESGVGKTTLVRELLSRLPASALVFGARCYERESVPYKAVDGVVDRVGQYLAKLPPEEAHALLPADIGLAATVFPVLAIADSVAKKAGPAPISWRPPQPLGDRGLVLDLLDDGAAPRAITPGNSGERLTPGARSPATPAALRDATSAAARMPEIDPAELRARVFATMRDLFVNLARKQPVVLAIDDLQWADADSLALLSEILRADAAPRGGETRPSILLFATVRTDSEVGPPPQLALQLAPRLVRTLHLTRLPPEEARELVAGLLRAFGVEAAPGFDVQTLLTEGSGHPLFLDALVRHRVARAEVAQAAPVRLDDALWSRIEALPPRARMLLTAISVAGTPVARKVAQHALSAEPDEIDRLIAGLLAEHFIRASAVTVEDALEPYHDRIRETALRRLVPSELRDWHARLALALETMGGGELSELAMHWQGAGDALRAADYAARAGDEAMAAFAFDRAARLYRTALALLPKGAAERPSLLLRLGDAHNNGGRGHDAAGAYLAAAELYPEASSMELRRRAAENLLRSGYIDEGMEHLRVVLEAVGIDFPETLPSTLAALLFRRAELRLRGLNFTPRAAESVPPQELRRVDVCWSAAKGLGMVDSLRGAFFQVRSLLFSLAAGDPYRVARSLALEMGFVATAGPSATARVEELRAAGQKAAERSRHPHAFAMMTALSGASTFMLGRFRDALPLLSEGEDALRNRCVGSAWEMGSTATFHLWALFWAGEYRLLCERSPVLVREAEERGDRYFATNLCSGFPNAAWLVLGEPDTAAARASTAIGPWTRAGAHLQHFHDVVARVQIDLYRGDGASAYTHISEGWKSLEDSMSMRIHVVRTTCEYLRGASAVLASWSELDAAPLLGVAAKAAKKLDAEKATWASALACFLRAAIKVREGERGTAVTSLLEEGERHATAAGMAGHTLAAQRAQALVRGGISARDKLQTIDNLLADRGVRDPSRFASMLLPGFERPDVR